ncbi:MAG: hypothetical protein DRQ43_00635, partial [Gammaproteobacteria bacterium]
DFWPQLRFKIMSVTYGFSFKTTFTGSPKCPSLMRERVQKRREMILEKIPDKYYEVMGIIVGLFASVSIGTQVFAEYSIDTPSTMSPFYAIGFLCIFMFWTIYGIRFRRVALWLTNGMAVFMQTLLLVIICLK